MGHGGGQGQGQDRLYGPWREGDHQRLGRQWGRGRDAEPGGANL